ncbi:MAG TPA: cytochrome P460 family protein [Polyangiaceae bacterium]|nr:cytochrome P460 family protein [Polyangiaceae bacterium]
MNNRRFKPWVSSSGGLCLCIWLQACSSSSSTSEGTAGSSPAAAGTSTGSAGTASTSGGSGGKPTDPAAGKSSTAGTSANAGTSSDAGAPSDAGAGGAPSGIPDIEAIMSEYHSYQPQTDEPEPVSAYIFGLCRLPTLPEQEFADSEHGDGRYLRDWANDLAVEGIARRGSPAFEPGSIIVKEKHVAVLSGSGFELAALGIMIKREAGFAPARQDWDYAYWERELGVIVTAEQSSYCAGCHAGAAETDSVFVDGLKP